MSACIISFVGLIMFPFDFVGGDVRREFLQRLSSTLYGTLGSYLHDALQEGNADVMAYLDIPRA
jgi:23S rRNA A1618 N6-methylase RlmF